MALTCDQITLHTQDKETIQLSRASLLKWSPMFVAHFNFHPLAEEVKVEFDLDTMQAFAAFCEAYETPGPWMQNVELVGRALPALHFYQAGLSWAKYVIEQNPSLDVIVQWEALVGYGQWSRETLLFLINHTMVAGKLDHLNKLVGMCSKETIIDLMRFIATEPVKFEHSSYQVSSFKYEDRLLHLGC